MNIDNLSVRYRQSGTAFSEVSMECRSGQLVCVLGANGAGKTTLLRAISNTLPLYGGFVAGGSITWQGQDITAIPPDRLVRMGVIQSPEGRGIFSSLTVDDNLRVGAFTRSRATVPDRLQASYELFPELSRLRSRRAGLLSGGEQQMLAIARSLMSDPHLLLLDEPSLGLAPKIIDRIAERIRGIHEKGTTVILVEQNAVMALELADHAFVLEGGRMALDGPAAELQRSDEVRRLYLGLSMTTSESQASRVDRRADGTD